MSLFPQKLLRIKLYAEIAAQINLYACGSLSTNI